MAPKLSFEAIILGEAQPSGSKTAGLTKDGRRFYRDANPGAAAWKATVRKETSAAMMGLPLLTGPLSLTAIFYAGRPKSHYRTKNGQPTDELKPGAPIFKTTKPDLDKLVRALKDGMTRAVYIDDSQVARHRLIDKLYGNPPRVELIVAQLEGEA